MSIGGHLVILRGTVKKMQAVVRADEPGGKLTWDGGSVWINIWLDDDFCSTTVGLDLGTVEEARKFVAGINALYPEPVVEPAPEQDQQSAAA